jgi:outer membrane protein TolC
MFSPIHLLAVCLAAAEAPPLTLKQALEQADTLSPEIQLARLKWLESIAETKAVRAGYQPQLSANVTAAYQTINLQGIGLFVPGFGGRVGPFRTFNARPVLTQTVLDLSLLSRMRAAREREDGLRFELETAREATRLAVAQIYLQIQQAESRIAASQARLRAAEALWRQSLDFEQAGTASKLDVARTAQRYRSEQAAVSGAVRDRDELTTLLLRTIGLDPAGRVRLAPLAAAGKLPEASAAAAVGQRAEIRALDSRIRAGQQEQAAALRQRLPRIGVSGDYGVAGAGPDRSLSTYTTGATLTIPLWTGRRIESEAEAARLRIEQSRAQRRAAELRIAQEVEQARIAIDAAARSLLSHEQAAGAAREALELSRLRFEAGIATSVDTTVAQAALAEAEDAVIRTRYEMRLAEARLAWAMGNLWSFAGE